MPKTAQQFKEIRKEKRKIILDVSIKLFAESGYIQTSISQIAKEAGISKGLIYNYFSSKEEILDVMMRDFFEEMIALMDPNRDEIIEDEEAEQLFDRFFDLMTTRHEEMKLYYQLSLQPEVLKTILTEDLLQTGSRSRSSYVNYFKTRFKEDADIMMMNLASVLKGFSLIYSLTPELYSKEMVERYKEYLKRLFLGK